MDKAAEDFLKAMESKSNLSNRMQKKTVDKIYNGLTSRRPVRVSSDLPISKKIEALSRLERRKSRKKWQAVLLLLSLLVLLLSLTGCSSKSIRMTSPSNSTTLDSNTESSVKEIPVSEEKANVSSNPTPGNSEAIATEPTTKESPAKINSRNKNTETDRSASKNRVSGAKNSGIKDQPSVTPITENEPTQEELRASNPPAIGKVVPWYEPTAETIAKAYTSVKPYEIGNNYALVKDGSSVILIYLAMSKNGVGYWTAYTLKNIEINIPSAPAKFERDVSTGSGMDGGILWLWSSETNSWVYSNTVRLAYPEDPRYNIVSQTWVGGKVITVGM